MRKLQDLSGQKFGWLTATHLSRIEKRTNRTIPFWLCTCVCGNKTEARTRDLKSGNTKSCGCMQGRRSTSQNSALNLVLKVYMKAAKLRGLEFKLKDEEFKQLISSPCHYCGSEPYNIKKTRWQTLVYSGIDRVENSIGYVSGNVVSCCIKCNWMKNNLTLEEFLVHLQRIACNTTPEYGTCSC